MSTQTFGRPLEDEPVEFGRPLKKVRRRSPAEKAGRAAARGGLKSIASMVELTPIYELARRLTGPEKDISLEKGIETLLPPDPEAGFTEKAIERGAEILPYLLGGEAALIPKIGRAGLAALLGQTTEELGGGELAQAGAEIAGLGLPGLRKKIIPKKGQKEAVKMLRRRGLAEKEIAPLIPSERKSALLGKLGTRGFRTAKAARRTRDALGNLYSKLAEEGERLPILTPNRASFLQSQLREKLEKMPSSVRRVVQEDLTDLFRKPVKANDLMNFWQDINSQINWKTIGGGKKRLNSLKDVLLGGMKDINPQLARDFELTNRQFSKFNKLYKNLKPESLDRWIALGEVGALFGSLFKFGPKGVATVIGADTARRVASEMLINPRLQNLTKQMATALNQNKLAIAKKIQEKMQEELEKEGINLP